MRNQLSFAGAAAPLDGLAAAEPTFHHPSDVLARGDLPVEERRAILADWGVRAARVENAPQLRQLETAPARL